MTDTTARRDAGERNANPADHLTAVVLFGGRFDYIDDVNVSTPCQPGDLLILDYGRSFTYRTPGHHGATVSLPRTFVEDGVGRSTVHGRLPGTAEVKLFENFVRSLIPQLPDLDTRSVPAVSAVVRHLLRAALATMRAGDDALPIDRDRDRARAYIDGEPSGLLDIETMAQTLGISRSRLYRMFKPDGGIRAYDRRRRLRLLHLALVEQPRRITLSEIAVQHGFFDLSSLARQFRGQFGHTMSEVRDHLPSPTRADGQAPVKPLTRYRDAIESLSRTPCPVSA